MKEVVAKFPDDLDAATIYAQSLMDTSPWSYWNADGSATATELGSFAPGAFGSQDAPSGGFGAEGNE